MRDGVRIAQKPFSEATAQKPPDAPPEDGGGFCANEAEGGFCTPRAETLELVITTDPEDENGFCADPPGPHTREAGGPVKEGQTWGGPEGLEMFVAQVDGIQLGPALPPADAGLMSETDEHPWKRFY